MKNFGWILGVTMLCLSVTILGCSKKKVRRNALEGTVYQVVSVSYFPGLSYAGWKNGGNTDPAVGGVQSTSASGTWDFTDLENIVVNMTYTYTIDGVEQSGGYSITGTLDMLGNSALGIGIESDLDYGYFPVHERKGKNLSLVLDESIESYAEYVSFVVLKKK